MKEIIAVLRPKKVEATKDALEKLGFSSITATSVMGRGKQNGIAGEVGYEIAPDVIKKESSGGMKYVPKRLISIIVNDDDVTDIIDEIVKINQTTQIGDGKIFVCPVDNVLRVRTNETGEQAVI